MTSSSISLPAPAQPAHAVMAQNAATMEAIDDSFWCSFPSRLTRRQRPEDCRGLLRQARQAPQHRRTDQRAPAPCREEDSRKRTRCSRATSASASSSSTPATSGRGSRTATTSPKTLEDSVEHLKTDRTEQDILFELLLKLGLDLSRADRAEDDRRQDRAQHRRAARCWSASPSKIAAAEVEPLALGIVDWHKELAPAGETHRRLPRQRLCRRRGQDQPHRHPPAARAGERAQPVRRDSHETSL